MKKQKRKFFFTFYKKVIFILIFVLGFSLGIAFAVVVFKETIIVNQTASGTGSYNSKISFRTEAITPTGTGAYYINQGNNSSIIGNSFSGYYYDSIYGYFKLDWSSDIEDNVRITESTNKCTTGYGYKLDGKAKGGWAGFIDFGYDDNTFVYYCMDDNKMYGRSYGEYIGYQDFEGITLEILPDVESLVEYVTEKDIFINDKSTIDNITSPTGKTSNAGNNELGGDKFDIDDTKESIFYIIK